MKRSAIVAVIGLGALAAAPAAQADGYLRVLHASPDAPAVDVYLNGAKAVPGLRPGAITGYVAVPDGKQRWAIRPKGARPSSRPVASGKIRIRDGKVYTVAATGFLRKQGRQAFRVRIYGDANAAAFGTAKLRVAHLSPDTPRVDIVVKGGGKVVRKLAYPQITGYLSLPAGRYTFYVRPAGTRINALTLRNVRVEAGKIYTAWALGALHGRRGDLRLRGVATNDALPAALERTQLRVLHASPDAPTVGVCVNGAVAIPSLAFGAAAPADGSYLALPSGPITVRIVAPNAPNCATSLAGLPDYPFTLPAGASLTVAASGEVAPGAGEQAFDLRALVDDVTPTAGAKARVTVAHLGSNVPPVSIFAGATDLFGASIAFGTQRTAELGAVSGANVDVKVGAAVAATIPNVTLAANRSTTVYAVGKASPGAGEQALAFVPLVTPVG